MSDTIYAPMSHRERTRRIKAEKCKRSLYEFTKEFWNIIEPGKPFIDGWHVRAICDHLQAVSEGQFRNLIICLPPGFAKSTLVSVMWFCWTWVDRPYIRALFGSYDEKLTYRDSGKCRDILRSKKFQKLFNPEWVIDKDSASLFSNNFYGNRKTYYMTSRKKTGWRGEYLIVDDPLSAEDRYDKNIKKQVVDTWDSTLWTRVNKTGHYAFVVIMQRLAEDDLVGHILEKYGSDYVQLILPNEYNPKKKCITPIYEDPRTEEGELLCPELMSEEATAEAKTRLGPVDYAAQYLHEPYPAGGDRFKSETFSYWNTTNNPYIIELVHRNKDKELIRIDRLDKFISADVASETKTQSDFSCFGLWARTNNNEIILLHRIKIKKNEPGAIADMKSLFEMRQYGRTPPSVVYVEDNGVGKPISQNAMDIGLPVMPISVHKDLVTRTTTAVVRIEGGQIFFPNYDVASWLHDFIKELLAFPNGKNDDQVSMLAIAANSVFEMTQTSPRSVATVNSQKGKINVNNHISLGRKNIFGNGHHDPIHRR
jgi:predicted phage terminase large subunit-like protein